MKTKLRAALGCSIMMAGLVAFAPASAEELDKVVFGTNWYAQAEHGGFYQALATGIYKEHGLDVEIKMGGPQVNGTQLLVSGRYDMLMGYPIGNIKVVWLDMVKYLLPRKNTLWGFVQKFKYVIFHFC